MLAARSFHYRLNNFHNFIKNHDIIGTIGLYRIEFQSRGSSYTHMTIWIKDTPRLGTVAS